ncbi:MAG: hypothetical protein CMH83_18060 [Nocardioides sp.]|nr:hypothetical protein [Nocardioides sp.]
MSSPRTLHPVAVLVSRVRQWPLTSQQQACRNAMVAATECARRRGEREDVADFLAARYAPAAAPTVQADAVSAPEVRAARG